MIIKAFTTGPLRVNNYLVICEKTKQAVLIDAGGDFESTVNLAKINDAQIKYVLNTHGHLDHIEGDFDLQNKLNAKIFLHKNDEILVNHFQDQMDFLGMYGYKSPKIDEYLENGQEIKLGSLNFKVIHTPGHSSGSTCFLIENVLFSGDTLFKKAIGITNLPGGSYNDIIDSIKNRLFILDDDIIVYPGHGKETTIGDEKKNLIGLFERFKD